MPDERRPIDIGYRGRPLPAYSGRGGLEKYEIGRRFAELAADSGLVLDIGLEEEDRLYGDKWPRFLSRCKGVLGVESGVSVFDVDDRVADQYERLARRWSQVTVEDLTEATELEDRIFYRTISPRHFEAAAMGCFQILFEGRYSGVLEPMEHYIPLRKDFSNFDEVLGLFRDPEVRRRITQNAYRDLIESGRYTYGSFIERFDADLIEAGVEPDRTDTSAAVVEKALGRGRRWRAFKVQLRWLAHTTLLGTIVIGRLFRLSKWVRGLFSRRHESTTPSP